VPWNFLNSPARFAFEARTLAIVHSPRKVYDHADPRRLLPAE
jgi:hypothetical protein